MILNVQMQPGILLGLNVHLRFGAFLGSRIHLLYKHSPGPECAVGLHIHLEPPVCVESAVSLGSDAHLDVVY